MLQTTILDESGRTKEGDKAPQPLGRADVSVAMAGCLDIGIMYSEVGCGWGSECSPSSGGGHF